MIGQRVFFGILKNLYVRFSFRVTFCHFVWGVSFWLLPAQNHWVSLRFPRGLNAMAETWTQRSRESQGRRGGWDRLSIPQKRKDLQVEMYEKGELGGGGRKWTHEMKKWVISIYNFWSDVMITLKYPSGFLLNTWNHRVRVKLCQSWFHSYFQNAWPMRLVWDDLVPWITLQPSQGWFLENQFFPWDLL